MMLFRKKGKYGTCNPAMSCYVGKLGVGGGGGGEGGRNHGKRSAHPWEHPRSKIFFVKKMLFDMTRKLENMSHQALVPVPIS